MRIRGAGQPYYNYTSVTEQSVVKRGSSHTWVLPRDPTHTPLPSKFPDGVVCGEKATIRNGHHNWREKHILAHCVTDKSHRLFSPCARHATIAATSCDTYKKSLCLVGRECNAQAATAVLKRCPWGAFPNTDAQQLSCTAFQFCLLRPFFISSEEPGWPNKTGLIGQPGLSVLDEKP